MYQDTRHELLAPILTDGVENEAHAEDADAPAVSRKVRHKRRLRARSKTIAPKRLTKEEIRFRDLLPMFEDPDRPQTRGQCKEDVRPWPYVACKHHLYLDVNPDTGSIKLNFPDLEVWEMAETCS